MPETSIPVSDYGVAEFYTLYLNPTRVGSRPPSHDGLAFVITPQEDIFDFCTEEPIPPTTDSPSAPAQQVRTIPCPGYLGQLNLDTYELRLYGKNYNNGNPTDPRLAEGFKNLAKLFGVEIPVGYVGVPPK